MGADLIGWRGCSLQKELGTQGFLAKLKLRSYKLAIETQVPAPQRETVKISIQVHGPTGVSERSVTYAEISSQAAEFARGIPECTSCPLSSGAPLGCYHFINYPVDPVFEKTVFEFFVSQLETKDSICDQLYRDIVSRVPSSGTGWHSRRGQDARTGALAQLPAPLVHEWGGTFSKKRVDSAQIMQVLFMTLEQPALVVAYARFWNELFGFAQARGVSFQTSPTFEAVARMGPMFLMTAAHSVGERWYIFADS